MQTKFIFYCIEMICSKSIIVTVILTVEIGNSWKMISENRTELILKLRKSVYKCKTGVDDLQDERKPEKKSKKTSNEIKLKGYCR